MLAEASTAPIEGEDRTQRLERGAVLVLRGLSVVVAGLPLSWALAVGRGIGALVFVLAGGRVARLIDPYFPGRGREIARAYLAHAGMAICEILRLPRCPQDLGRVEVVGAQHLPAGGGVLLIGHLGNFELLAARLGRLGRPMAVLANHTGSPLYHLLSQIRLSYGLELIWTSGSARRLAGALLRARRLLDAGHVVIFAVDIPVMHGAAYSFLGTDRRFPEGAALLARRTGKPLIGAFITRTAAGHRVELVPLPQHEGMTAFVHLLEARTRAKPEEYLWGA